MASFTRRQLDSEQSTRVRVGRCTQHRPAQGGEQGAKRGSHWPQEVSARAGPGKSPEEFVLAGMEYS